MSLTLFKPNASNTGILASFKVGAPEKDKGDIPLFIELVQQASWNAQSKSGSFSANASNPDKKLTAKLNEIEVGGIIYAIKTQTKWSGYHSFGANKLQISFDFALKGDKPGFFFSILRNGTDKFRLGLSVAEAEVLLAFFDFYLKTKFAEANKAQKERFAARSGAQAPAPKANAPQARKAAPEPAPEDDAFDDGTSAPAEEPPAEEAQEDEVNPFG